MIPSLMKVYNYNNSRNLNDISIFEMAKGFYLKDNNYGEDYKLCILMSGNYINELGNKKKVDFYILKGIIEEILHYLGYNNRYTFELGNFPKEFHPGQSAYINVAGKVIGLMGKLHPNIVSEDVFVAEINLDKLYQNRTGKIKYKEINKYPTISKDFAVILDKNIMAEDIMKTIKKAGGKTLTKIEVFDVYRGKNIDEDKKSIAFSLTFEDYTKTLTDEEVTIAFERVIKEVENKYKASLRNN
jgi:phenylalanyl-tRNA synthetase beta chain